LDRKFLALDEQAALRNHLNVLMKPNGKADQRRTTDSASSLDSIRRLIQRVVIPPALDEKARLG